MYGFMPIFWTRGRSIGLVIRSPLPWRSFMYSSPSLRTRHSKQIICFGDRTLTTNTKANVYLTHCQEVYMSSKPEDILWWMKKCLLFSKTSSLELVDRIDYSNILGLDANLKDGLIVEERPCWDILKFKLCYPKDVVLYRGMPTEFFEALGFDACFLVEYTSVNPVGGADSVPKACFSADNLPQILDDLTSNGFSVLIIEKAYEPTNTYYIHYMAGRATSERCYVFNTDKHNRACMDSNNVLNPQYEGTIYNSFPGIVNIVYSVCQHMLTTLYKVPFETAKSLSVVAVYPGEEPSTSDSCSTCIYVMMIIGGTVHVGQTHDIQLQIRKHRSKRWRKNALFVYFKLFKEEWSLALQNAIIEELPRYGIMNLY